MKYTFISGADTYHKLNIPKTKIYCKLYIGFTMLQFNKNTKYNKKLCKWVLLCCALDAEWVTIIGLLN